MNIETLEYSNNTWKKEKDTHLKSTNIVFAFGDRESIEKAEVYEGLKELYPNAQIVGCSSSGNILDENVRDTEMVATAISFDSGHVEISVKDFVEGDNIELLGRELIEALPSENLKHVFILSDGLNINGSALAKGANSVVEKGVPITGGLAGDGTDFQKTVVMANDVAKTNRVVAIGFYGENISVENGCFAGWDEFGVLRKITKSKENILYEIDGEPALKLYKKYLGEYAKDLPGSALHFPISIKADNESKSIIRTVLGVDEETQSLSFAGDVPEGYLARLMKTNIDGLIDGSEIAAEQISKINEKKALGLVVSCVGRRLVLKQLTDEELESIGDTLGSNVQLVGFYSYGELAPFSNELLSCNLHNQTMTLTVIYES